ncbi:MAG: Zn-ribbon domain-containing OB-fold protein, partial [Janthinobacterium lividum]
TLLSWTTFHRQYLPAFPPPHTVVAIRLEEGPIMASCVERSLVTSLIMNGSVVLVYGDHPDGYRIPMIQPGL